MTISSPAMLGTDRFVEAAAGPQIDALGCALGSAVSTVHYGSNLRSNDLKNYFLGSCVSCKVVGLEPEGR